MLTKRHEYCQMLGLPCLEYGYETEVKLLAKYFGLRSAERLPSKDSFEFLDMQAYPKTINELADIDEDRFNRDVIIARVSLKTVINTMQTTRLVKLILARYAGHKYLVKTTGDELNDLLQEE